MQALEAEKKSIGKNLCLIAFNFIFKISDDA